MKLAPNWFLHELVHPDILDRIGDRAADFLNPNLAPTLQSIRDKFGVMVVNGMYSGKLFTSSGLRLPHGHVGAMLSSHKFGCAADCKFMGVKPIDVQSYIINNQDEFPYISRMESALVTKTWLHIETQTEKREGSIHVFNP